MKHSVFTIICMLVSYGAIISDISRRSWSTARIYSIPPPNCKHNLLAPSLLTETPTSTLLSKPEWSLFLSPKLACEQDVPTSQSEIISHGLPLQSMQSRISPLMVLMEEEKISKIKSKVKISKIKLHLLSSAQASEGARKRKLPDHFRESRLKVWELFTLYHEHSKDHTHNSAHHVRTHEETLPRFIFSETKRNCNVSSS